MALANENSLQLTPTNCNQMNRLIMTQTMQPDQIIFGPWLQPHTTTNEIPSIFDMYKDAIKNTLDCRRDRFLDDHVDLRNMQKRKAPNQSTGSIFCYR